MRREEEEEEETERVMAEHNHSNSSLQPILDLLFAAGYVESDAPPSQIIAGGISWAIAALNANTTTAMQVSLSPFLSIKLVRVCLSGQL